MAGHPDHAALCKLFPDVDPFVLKKWERVFYVFFDQNASEAVDWGDFALVVRHCRDIYGAQSEQMSYARSAMKKLWEGLKKEADTNKDNLISLEEWCGVLKTTDPKHENKWFNEYLEFMFKLFDVSADNEIDICEYTDGMRAYTCDEPEAQEAFKKMAFDNKGKPVPAISKDHWAELFHEYLHSTDKAARGNWLFGPMKGITDQLSWDTYPKSTAVCGTGGVDADGKVDQFEYTDGMHAHGFDDAAANEAFKLIAKDQKGNDIPDLPKDLWLERFHEYFHSTDKNAPGNHLFGKLPADF